MDVTMKQLVALHTARNIADRDVVNLQGVRNVRKAGLGSASVMVEEDAANLMDARKEHETRNFAHLTEAGGVATLTLAPN